MAIAAAASTITPSTSCCSKKPYNYLNSSSLFIFKPHRPSPPFRIRRFSPSPPTCRRRRLIPQLRAAHAPDDLPVSPEEGSGDQREHGFPRAERRSGGSPVFVTLPVDSVSREGEMTRKKIMEASFRALKMGGVEGVVVDVWWGIVEREAPRVYDWKGYFELVETVARSGLKVRAIMSFHRCCVGRASAADSCWIPLPKWVVEEMEKVPDLSFSDRLGRRSMECLSLGCDLLPIVRGRSPLQMYSDFMRDFRDAFREFLGVSITGIQIGMGPSGELRYPSSTLHQGTGASLEIGEFQCYDKFMRASLRASASSIGVMKWGDVSPYDKSDLEEKNPEKTRFFKNKGLWNAPHGRFFLEWYSGLLLLHGERLCMAAESIFYRTGVRLYGKIAGTHWHYLTDSHASELTSGYYNTSGRDGYLPIARIFGRYGVTLCCSCFDLLDKEEKKINTFSSPEGFVKQVVHAAFWSNIPVSGENSLSRVDDSSSKQAREAFKTLPADYFESSFSFNFVRMDKGMFRGNNWVRFLQFVRLLSNNGNFRSQFDSGGSTLSLSCKRTVEIPRKTLAYY